jgi:hypothetical protein
MGKFGTFRHMGIPVRDQLVTTGNTWYVHNGTGLDGNIGDAPVRPFKTLDYAIGKCTASKGDVIYVMPGHTENIAAAGAIAMDVAGINVVGIGRGSLRPTFTLTAAASSVTISAADCMISNCIFTAGFADVATCFTVSAKNARIEKCFFNESAVDLNWLSCILTDAVDNSCDGLQVVGCKRTSIDAAALAMISILGNINDLMVEDNFDNQASAANVGHFMICSSKVLLSASIQRNVLNLTGDNNAQAVGVFQTGSSSTSTGIMAWNLVGSLDTGTELIVTASQGFQMFNNYYTGTANASGKLWPVVDVA